MNGTLLIDDEQPQQLQQPQQYYNHNNYNNQHINNLTTDNFSSRIINNDEHIKKISRDILNGLTDNNISLHDSDEEEIPKKKNKKKEKYNNLKETVNYVMNDPKKSIIDYIYDVFLLKDFLIIFILYLFLSQDMIKDFFANYFTCINPNEDGKVGIKGVVIYGLILAVLFVLVKNIISTF